MKLGIYGHFPEALGAADYLELPVRILPDLKPAALRKLEGRCVLIAGAPQVYRSEWPDLEEWISILRPHALVWSLPPAFEIKGDLALLQQATRRSFGLDLPAYWDARFRCADGVHDPLAPRGFTHASGPRGSRYWRIHGWHESRWVRRYSESQLRELWAGAEKHRPDFLTLAHSQRRDQLLELRRIASSAA